MSTITEHPLLLAASLALMPAVITWLLGRGLAGRIDDKSLPERLLAYQRRTGVAIGVTATVIGYASPAAFYDGTRTRFFRIAADGGAVTGFGWLDGRFIGNGDVLEGWRTGWIGSTAVAIDLLNGRALRVPRSEGMVGQLAVSGKRLAAIVFDGGSYHLRIYEIDPPAGEDSRRAEKGDREQAREKLKSRGSGLGARGSEAGGTQRQPGQI